jgi:poly-beta-1,6-N-acetyl-D-glucosamine synthase
MDEQSRSMIFVDGGVRDAIDLETRLIGSSSRARSYRKSTVTEDNELTLAIKSLGWRCTSPSDCHVTTELMPTWGDLWRQRMRWQGAAIENLRAYGWTLTTRRYWGQQLGMALGVLAMATFVLYLALSVRTWTFHPFWTSITGVFVLERTVTVRRGGWRAVLTAAPLVVEVVYDLFLQAVLIASYAQIATRREAKWHHINPKPAKG